MVRCSKVVPCHSRSSICALGAVVRADTPHVARRERAGKPPPLGVGSVTAQSSIERDSTGRARVPVGRDGALRSWPGGRGAVSFGGGTRMDEAALVWKAPSEDGGS